MAHNTTTATPHPINRPLFLSTQIPAAAEHAVTSTRTAYRAKTGREASKVERVRKPIAD